MSHPPNAPDQPERPAHPGPRLSHAGDLRSESQPGHQARPVRRRRWSADARRAPAGSSPASITSRASSAISCSRSRSRSATSTTSAGWASTAATATRPSRISANAGLPPTQTCMTCHSQIWTNAEMLEPVRAELGEGEPIRWNRVHDLPDFAYFNHSIHVAKGVGCTTCHGRVDQMPLTWKTQPAHGAGAWTATGIPAPTPAAGARCSTWTGQPHGRTTSGDSAGRLRHPARHLVGLFGMPPMNDDISADCTAA